MKRFTGFLWNDNRFERKAQKMSLDDILRKYFRAKNRQKRLRWLFCLIKKVEGNKLRLSVMVHRIIRDSELEKDFFVELLLHIDDKLNEKNAPDNIAAWMSRVSRNKAINFILKKENKIYSDSLEINEEIYQDKLISKTEKQIDIRNILERMKESVPEKGWEAILLISSGLSYVEAAQQMDLTIMEFRSKYQWARKKLKDLFGEEYKSHLQ